MKRARRFPEKRGETSNQDCGSNPSSRIWASSRSATFLRRGEFASNGVAFLEDGIAFQGERIAFEGEFSEREEPLAGRVDEDQLALRKIEAHAETGTDPSIYRVDFASSLSPVRCQPIELERLRVIDVVFLDPVTAGRSRTS